MESVAVNPVTLANDMMDVYHDVVPESSLLRLDDMVLSKIVKNLGVSDVANLGRTCKRLARISDEQLGRYHGSLHWKYIPTSDENGISTSQTKELWKHCGKHVKTVKLSYWVNESLREVFLILAKHCENLESLTLNYVEMTNLTGFNCPLIFSMFSKLKRFELIGCEWRRSPFDLFCYQNRNLEQLSLINCFRIYHDTRPLSLSVFSALTTLTIQHCLGILENDDLLQCFQKNKITSLVVSDVKNIRVFGSNLIDGLVDNVEALTVDYVNLSAKELSKLKKLRSLTIHCKDVSNIDTDLAESNANLIEELVLTQTVISRRTIRIFSNFTSLTKLRLNRCRNMVPIEFFKNLHQALPKLNQFTYAYNEIKDRNIVYLVQSMPTLKRLSLFGCNALKTKTYFEIEKAVHCWPRQTLELIPPEFESSKALDDIECVRKTVWLRTDISERLSALPLRRWKQSTQISTTK